jgi:hypothetical protein
VWQDAYPPAICVRILEIRRVKQSVLGFLSTYMCAQQFQQLLKFKAQKNISVCYWYISNTNLEKKCRFPELRIYQK